MVDAANITQYNLSHNVLEAHAVFWVLAAGKNGTRAAEVTNNIRCDLRLEWPSKTLFEVLQQFTQEETVELCRTYKTGCQGSKGRSLYELCRAGLNLKTCTAEDLEKIYGIGMKTSRCFIIHSRENAQYAGLDTHILKHLRELGYDAPKSTPSSRKKYLTLEKVVLTLAKDAGKTPAEYDLEVWNKYKIVN